MNAMLRTVVLALSAWMLAGCLSSQAPRVDYTTLTGQVLKPADYQGDVMVVNFWATSCTTCVKEMPALIDTHNKYKAQGLRTIAVAMSYDRPDYISTFVKDRNIPFLVIHDKDNVWTKAYGDVAVTPTTFLVDREGNIMKRYVGEPNFSELRKILAKELG